MADLPEGSAEIEAKAADRLTFFSDAVVAIAITLLALELPVPAGDSNAEFWVDVNDHVNDYVAFIISFAVISAHWFGHHRVYRYLIAAPQAVRRWNMLWLLTIVLTPLTTKVLSDSGAFESRFTIYAAGQALCGILFLLGVRAIVKAGALDPTAPTDLVANSFARLGAVVSMFLISIPIAFFTQWAYVTWMLIPAAGPPIRAIQRRRAARST